MNGVKYCFAAFRSLKSVWKSFELLQVYISVEIFFKPTKMTDELRKGISSLNKGMAAYAKSTVVSVAPARTRLLLGD